MRILQLTSHLNVGGVTSYVLSVSRALASRGHHVVIASDRGVRGGELAAAGLTHWRVPLHTSVELSPQVFWAIRQLAGRLRAEPVDVIHAHTRVGQVVAERLARQFHIPYVTTWHGFFRPNLGRRLWPCAGEVTMAISEPVREHLVRDFHVPPERVRLIENGIDVDYFSEAPDGAAVAAYRAGHQIPDRCWIVGSVGRLASGRVKGFDVLLEASCLLKDEMPDLHVLIVGDGPRRPFVEEKIQQLGLQDRVHLAGAAMDVRLPLALIDAFLFPVRWQEGFGLSLIEAMAAGKPVVASRIGAVPDIIRHGESGWLATPEDPASFAEGIRRLRQEPAVAARFGREAQRRVRERFSLDRMVDAIEEIYHGLVDRAS